MEEKAIFKCCGPSKDKCVCHCPDECGHVWDGPEVLLGGDTRETANGSSASCSRCGMIVMQHDMWVMP